MAKEKEIAIEVKGLSKSFRLPSEKASGIKQAFVNWTRGVKGYTEQKVLRNISFKVEKGDFFGIVGRNGSGKSTLLKLISQIYYPEKGTVAINGSLVSFIELGVGFNPELTGRENIYLNGALLGFSTKEIDEMYDDIVDFAELHEFMGQKLKNYSSGMQVRLAFSCAIRAKSDILVLDEILAVGDEAFQRKCNDYFDKIKQDKSKTIVLVTHSMASVKKYCTKAILINKGRIEISGSPENVADQYTIENMKQNTQDAPDGRTFPVGLSERVPELRNEPVSNIMLTRKDTFIFEIKYKFDEKIEFFVAFSMYDIRRGGVTYDSGFTAVKNGRSQTAKFELPLRLFNDGEFKIISSIWAKDKNGEFETLAYTNDDNACYFSIRNNDGSGDFALLHKL